MIDQRPVLIAALAIAFNIVRAAIKTDLCSLYTALQLQRKAGRS